MSKKISLLAFKQEEVSKEFPTYKDSLLCGFNYDNQV
jgi:hypothetical protein